MSAITISSHEAGKTCPYCRFPLKSGGLAERCDACGTIHHEECWRDGNGCAVLGCQNAGTARGAAVEVPSGSSTGASVPVQAPFSMPPQQPSNGNRNMMIGLVAGLLIAAAGVGAFIATRSTKSTAPPIPVTTVQTIQVTTQPLASPASKKPATGSAEGRKARQLAGIVQFSQAGRVAVRGGLYEEAIANRQATLAQLEQLAGGSTRLQRAKQTFQRAIEASLQSDEAYAVGGDASSSDALATRLKRLFASEFNPIARRYGIPPFDPNEI